MQLSGPIRQLDIAWHVEIRDEVAPIQFAYASSPTPN
jgi:hypothetical protein